MKSTLFFLSGLVLALLTANTARAQENATVDRVISGAMFRTSTGKIITLLGVGAPKREGITSENARNRLEEILSGNSVLLYTDSLVRDPASGPVPRYVYDMEGRLVNMIMIDEGFGAATLSPSHSMTEKFVLAEQSQKLVGKGSEEAGGVLDGILPSIVRDILPGLLSGSDETDNQEKTNDRTTKSGKSTQKKSSASSSSNNDSSSTSAQCSAITKKGTRCSRMTTNSNGRCWQHK